VDESDDDSSDDKSQATGGMGSLSEERVILSQPVPEISDVLEGAEKQEKNKRSKKKQKFKHFDSTAEKTEQVDIETSIPQQPLSEQKDIVLDSTTSRISSPAAPNYLPSFPLPSGPAPPSKASLSLQGLDKGLIDAEIVDPAHTLPLLIRDVNDDTGDSTGLSDKTKLRLQELGITELFAGMFSLFVCFSFISFRGNLTHSSISPNGSAALPPSARCTQSLILPTPSPQRCVCVCSYRKWQDTRLRFTDC